MVTPSDNSEQIRCGMCGKPNPPDAESCEHCGARLKPVTSPEDLLNMGGPAAGRSPGDLAAGGRKRDTGDLFDSLRSQFGDPQDEPSSGDEDWSEPETDFRFGSATGDDEDALPPFLGASRDAEPPGSDDPFDWLSAPPEGFDSSPDAPDIEDALDWLTSEPDTTGEPAPPAPVTEPEPPPAAPVQPPQPPPLPPQEESTPDWLSEFEGASEPAQTSTTDDAPDWLNEFGLPAASTPQSGEEATAMPADQLPDWLSEMAGLAPEESAVAPESSDLLSAFPEDDDSLLFVPMGAEEVDEAVQPSETPGDDLPSVDEVLGGPPLADDAVPDWLADLGPDTGEAAPPVEEMPAEEKPMLQPLDDSLPPPLPGGDLPGGPLPSGGVPSWLTQQRAEEAAEDEAERAAAEAAASVEQEEPVSPAPESVVVAPPPIAEEEDELIPDWLTEAASEAGEETEEEAIPEWMAGLTADAEPEASEPSAPAEEPGGEEVSAWLAGLSADSEPQLVAEPVVEEEEEEAEEEPPQPEEAQEEVSLDWLDQAAAEEPVEEDEEDWLAVLDFSDEPVAPVGVDLLGLSTELEEPVVEPPKEEEPPPSAEEEQEVRAADFGELPEWLQGMGKVAGMPAQPRRPQVAAAAGVSPEELEQIQDLRFEALTGAQATDRDEQAESVGALKDVRGVIQPELIFEGSTLTAAEPIEQIVITDAQTRQVEMVQRLLARESDAFAAVEKKSRLPIVRWLIAVVMILAVAAPLLMGLFILPPPAPSPDVSAAYDAIEGIAALDAVVLVAFEYEPDSAGEIEPLADALLWHLAQRPNITVYTITTQPTGVAMADAVLSRPSIQSHLLENGGTWQNLGYVSGRANGVSSLAVGAEIDPASPLSFDASGQPTGLEGNNLTAASVDHLIVLAARPEDARIWIEQASRPTGIPILAAVGASAAPLLRPYADSGQLVALLSGLNDAVAYWRQGGHQVGRALLSLYNAQAVGSVIAAALILIGGIVYGTLLRRSQTEDPS